MTIEITAIKFTDEDITITGNNLETILYQDNLFEDCETPEVNFEFNKKAYNGAALRYLYKLCSCFAKTKKEKSLGAKIEALKGEIVNIPDYYIKKKKAK